MNQSLSIPMHLRVAAIEVSQSSENELRQIGLYDPRECKEIDATDYAGDIASASSSHSTCGEVTTKRQVND
ncbi:MAG: hypothetical protein ABJQ90_16285 [Parasphingorhabdus sp.]